MSADIGPGTELVAISDITLWCGDINTGRVLVGAGKICTVNEVGPSNGWVCTAETPGAPIHLVEYRCGDLWFCTCDFKPRDGLLERFLGRATDVNEPTRVCGPA